MSGMSFLEGRLKGAHLNGISFSAISTLHVPTAQVHGDTAVLEAHPFQLSPASVFEFITRTCTGGLPFRSATRWGDGILSVDLYGLELAIPNMQGSPADKMSFRLNCLYNDGPDALLRAELEYKSPAFYMFQLAELPIVISELEISIKEGVAATLIAGGVDLFWAVAGKYNLPLRGMNIAMDDATAIATSIAKRKKAQYDMDLNPSSMIFESTSRGYGHSYDKLTIDNIPDLSVTFDDVPDLSVKFSPDKTHIPTLHGHDLEGPSIIMLQNIPISASGAHSTVEPFITNLVRAAATMRPTLPLVHR